MRLLIWIVMALVVFIVQIATVLIMEFRHPSKTVAWLMILFIFPIVGFVMYYFLAKEFRQRRMVRNKDRTITKETSRNISKQSKIAMHVEDLTNDDFKHQQRLFGLLQNIPDAPITQCNETTILTNAREAYKAIIEAIEQAKDHIHLEYYIFRDDEIGREITRILIRKAEEGIRVRFIFDGVGSYDLASAFKQQLIDAGVEVSCFLPPFIAFFDKRMNYRNHRKIVVVDGEVGFLGGINIGDEYLGKDPKVGFWRDTHMRVKGDAVYYLQHTFLADWAFVSGKKLIDQDRYFPKHHCPRSEQVQIIASGPDTNWDPILEVYFGALNAARQRIYISHRLILFRITASGWR
jgi:cardiolipin synthase